MHRTLSRQLRRVCGVESDESLPQIWAKMTDLAARQDVDPDLSSLLSGLQELIGKIDTTYEQYDRDLDLRSRSLEESSSELSAINELMRADIASRNRVMASVRTAVADLLSHGDSGLVLPSEEDLEGLSALLPDLVKLQENRRIDLLNQRFAMDQHAIVSITDTSGQITYVNDKFVEISGYQREELLGKSHQLINSKHHAPDFFAHMWQTIQAGKVWHGEICNAKKNGEHYWVDATIVPFLDQQGKPYEYIAIRTDITGQKNAELTLLQAKEAAESASRAKSEFLANMSHEIRTPMNGIIGMTDLVLDTSLENHQREYLNVVKSSAHALLLIINAILDFSKIEAGKMTLESTSFEFGKVILDTLRTVTLRAQEKHLELALDSDPDIPRFALGDPVRLRQILTNLVGNAIKFTEKGEVVVRIRLLSKQSTSMQLEIRVSDSGIGIPKDKQSKIFEAFEQEDGSTTRRFGGTGLGLSITKRLVNMMGGEIAVESEVGRGSHFIVTLPLGIDTTNPQAQPVISQGALQGRHILLIDDNQTNLIILQTMLTRWGATTQLQFAGDQALTYCQATTNKVPDCVIMDYAMPRMNGFQTAFALSEMPHYKQVPIVILSSSGMPPEAQKYQAPAIKAYLMKPASQDEIYMTLCQAMHRCQAIPHTASTQTTVSTPDQAPPMKILLVEDNLLNQQLAVALLKKWGHQIKVANNGQEALDCHAAERYSLILMDLQMPVMGGLDATAKIREREAKGAQRTTIIAMTANALDGDQEKCIAGGMDDYLSKPFKQEEFQRLLKKYAN